jgi:hypothetical protein
LILRAGRIWVCVRREDLGRHRCRNPETAASQYRRIITSDQVLPIFNRFLSPILCAALISCGHGEPFSPERQTPEGPFSSLLPRRITFSPGDDRTPAWLPDGSAVIYSSEREDQLDHDRCLTLLPAEGGTILDQFCPSDPVQSDSTNLYDAPAVSPDGQVFYRGVVSWVGQQKLGDASLFLAPLADPVRGTRLTRIPYTAPNGKIHSSIRSPAWLGSTSLVYLAEELFYMGSTFFPDTFVTGRDIVRLDVGGTAQQLSVIPGTDNASSVAVSGEAEVIYYTLGGDSRVYRRDLQSGTVTVVYDFGTGEIARDVTIQGSQLAAVVGGSVLYQFHPPLNDFVQWDEGGDLHLVDLATAAHGVVATDSVLFRHPVFAPGGDRLVVEVSPFAVVQPNPDSDFNATNHRVDLWLFDMP